MFSSHELQTCDWPRNVGCDGTSAVGGEELERINERDPPPRPPPRRTPPPPPPRVQPNPVITSRGQPKFSRQEYEKVFNVEYKRQLPHDCRLLSGTLIIFRFHYSNNNYTKK